jgi:hypothetical protein
MPKGKTIWRASSLSFRSLLSAGLILLSGHAHAVVITYTDEDAYLNDLQAFQYSALLEGFEGDAWSAARSPAKAPSVESQGIAWTSNNRTSEVTTGGGAARTGNWGFYSVPHGDFDQHNPPSKDCTIPGNCGDGLAGSSSELLFGVGGWLTSNTQSAKVDLLIDDVTVDFGAACEPDDCIITASYRFFGVIDTDGFTSFVFDEIEGTLDDQEFIFADDFTLAVPEPARDALSSTVLVALGVISLARRRHERRAS